MNYWNNLSHDYVNASSVNMFKNKIDNYLARASYSYVEHLNVLEIILIRIKFIIYSYIYFLLIYYYNKWCYCRTFYVFISFTCILF